MADTNPASPKPNKKLLYGLMAAVAIIIIVVVLVLTLGGGKTDNDSSSKNSEKTSQNDQGKNNEAVTASTISDFSIVCQGGSIKNAAALDKAKKPYIVFGFDKSRINPDTWDTLSVGYGQPFYSGMSAQALKTVNVVACLAPVPSADKVARTCDFNSDGKTIKADYISSQYSVAYYAAKTGEKLGTGETVPAPATSCPSFAAIGSDKKIYAEPDTHSTNAEIAKFAD